MWEREIASGTNSLSKEGKTPETERAAKKERAIEKKSRKARWKSARQGEKIHDMHRLASQIVSFVLLTFFALASFFHPYRWRPASLRQLRLRRHIHIQSTHHIIAFFSPSIVFLAELQPQKPKSAPPRPRDPPFPLSLATNTQARKPKPGRERQKI